MKKIRYLLFALLALSLPFQVGLDCSVGGDPTPAAVGLMYVLDDFEDAVYVLEPVDSIDGTITPSRTISGDDTLIQTPTALSIDTKHDILYVADSKEQGILVFTQASNADGNQSPRRVFTGVDKVVSLYYDQENDDLYAADTFQNAILAYNNASTLSDGSAPTRTIPLEFEPSAIFVDTQRDFLYVGDPQDQAVQVFSNASTLAVKTVPGRTITDGSQNFVNLNSITMNIPNNILFVAENANPSVEIFDSASNLNGEEDPDRQLEGDATELTIHLGQTLFQSNVLYVIPNDVSTSVLIFENANQVNGDTAPTRTVTVDGATELIGVAVDLAH